MTDEKAEKCKSIIKNYKLIGLFEGATLIMLILKLMGYTSISWFWVLLPVILHAILILVLIVVIILVVITAVVVATLLTK